MTDIPTQNTTADLSYNEDLCYPFDIMYGLKFQAFRLYLPTFPREDIGTILEIPLSLSRKFAIGIENYFLNIVELLITYKDEPEKFKYFIQSYQSKRFLEISTENQIESNTVFHKKRSIFTTMKQKYVLNNLKNRTGSIRLEIFKDIPALTRKNLMDNCQALVEIQCCWFINIIGSIYFKDQNLFLRIIEDGLDLHCLNDIFHREKETINQELRIKVGQFMAAEALTAIDFLHERGITHRFICPANIYLDFRGHLKIGNLFESMNANRDLTILLNSSSTKLLNDIWFRKLNQNYLDPEVGQHILKKQYLEAYIHLDCLADIFSIGIIVIEILSGINLLNMCNDEYNATLSPILNNAKKIDLFLKPEMQIVLRQKLSKICGFISKEFYAFLLLILQPKINRMKGLRMHVQRHRYFNSSGCEYKLRLDLVQKHPAFNKLNMDKIMVQPSPILQLLTTLNSF